MLYATCLPFIDHLVQHLPPTATTHNTATADDGAARFDVGRPGFVASYLRCTAERNQTHTWKVALLCEEEHANYFLKKTDP